MNKITLHQGDVRRLCRKYPDGYFHCVITSPPYYGLRDYGLEPIVWGGREDCRHKWGIVETGFKNSSKGNDGSTTATNPNHATNARFDSKHQFCTLCGAWRGSFGLEPALDCLGWATGTPCGQCYICHSLEIYREIWRVLRDDGTFWLNIGDSYASAPGGNDPYNSARICDKKRKFPGLKPKDLCGVPFRLALALQSQGWYLRSDIIWAKPNPMPESCTDRPTKAHEYLFLLTKKPRYFYDQEAVREEQSQGTFERYRLNEKIPSFNKFGGSSRKNKSFTDATPIAILPNGRNLRSVWTIATHCFPEAHFATFPPELARRCIEAGTSEKGCCPKCGAPWERVVEKKGGTIGQSGHNHEKDLLRGQRGGDGGKNLAAELYGTYQTTTTGWRPTCHCPHNAADLVPAAVLDPFSGSGTTCETAAKLGRDAVGFDLNPDYLEMSRQRVTNSLGMLAEIEVL